MVDNYSLLIPDIHISLLLIYNLYLDLDGIKQDKYQIPHPNGELTFKAPDVFDSSKPLRLKGKGYRNGDMYVKLHVKFDRSIK